MVGNTQIAISESIAPNVAFNRERRRIQDSLLFLKDKAAALKLDTQQGALAMSQEDKEMTDEDYRTIINALDRIHAKLAI